MPVDPETASQLAQAKTTGALGGGGGLLALGYSALDWFKKSGSMKRIKEQIEKLSDEQTSQAKSLAIIEAKMITKDDLQVLTTAMTSRIDHLFEQKGS
jgi:hypothetical protein